MWYVEQISIKGITVYLTKKEGYWFYGYTMLDMSHAPRKVR